jgi:ribokinase
MGRVLVVGSANLDFVFRSPKLPVAGETVLGTGFCTLPGGKGANQAVAIGRLGGDVAFCGSVGTDTYGGELKRSLSNAGVDLRFVREVDGPTGAAAVLVDDSGENQIVVSPGANARVDREQVAVAMAAYEPSIVLAQLEVPMEAVAEASKAPRFILNPAPAAPLGDELLGRCFALTPNESEAELLTGIRPEDEETCCAAADRLLAKGVRNVVITLGAQGCFWSTPNGYAFLSPPRVDVVDTTAAGDAFSGALSLFLAEGSEFFEALQLASRVAALSTTRAGAQSSMPTREEVRRLSETYVG